MSVGDGKKELRERENGKMRGGEPEGKGGAATEVFTWRRWVGDHINGEEMTDVPPGGAV